MLRELELEPWPLVAPQLEALLAAFRESRANGGALFARFRIAADRRLHWFASRDQWQHIPFLEAVLSSPVLLASLPELRDLDPSRHPPCPPPSLEPVSAYVLDGEIAAELASGDAYRSFTGTPREAKALAAAAVDALIAGRYDEVMTYRTYERWAPFFGGVIGDATWIGIDKREAARWILCVTDTD